MVLRCSNPDDRDPSRTGNSRDNDPGSRQAAVSHTIVTEGSAVALSALAQDKCYNRERDGQRRPNHACENIERGLSAHDAPHCIAEQRLLSRERYARGAILFLRALTHAFLTRPRVMRGARSRRLRLRRSWYRSGRDGAPFGWSY